MRRLAIVLALLVAPAGAGAHGDAHPTAGAEKSTGAKDSDPDAPALAYELPAAGSYELPPILRVGDHALLGSDGEGAEILGLAPGQLAVVSFVYLGCRDPGGCPLALATLVRLDRALAARRDLASRVRLVTAWCAPMIVRARSVVRRRSSSSDASGLISIEARASSWSWAA